MKKKVFILGDSICIYYSPYLLEMLKNDFDCMTKKGRAEAMKDLDVPIKANAGNTNNILSFLKLEEENGNLNYDYLVFNSGLHDIVYSYDKETQILATKPKVSKEKYYQNLNTIIDKVKKYNIKPIFVTTTPIEDERHNSRASFKRYGADVISYNEVAKKVMSEREIPVIDLFEFTESLEGERFRDHAHYLDEVAEKQAKFINGEFRKIVENY